MFVVMGRLPKRNNGQINGNGSSSSTKKYTAPTLSTWLLVLVASAISFMAGNFHAFHAGIGNCQDLNPQGQNQLQAPLSFQQSFKIPASGKERLSKNNFNNPVLVERGATELRKPSVPLRPINLEIIQKAKVVDLSYVDVTGGHKEHPHMGAKDEFGNFGYVHDETALRKNPPPTLTHFQGQELTDACRKRDDNYQMLTQKVAIDWDAYKQLEERNAPIRQHNKLFCLVYTIEPAHHKIPAIRETWA
jgi:hypothetical protein